MHLSSTSGIIELFLVDNRASLSLNLGPTSLISAISHKVVDIVGHIDQYC
jgi:hypothetical protein